MKQSLYDQMMYADNVHKIWTVIKENNIKGEDIPLQVKKRINELGKKVPRDVGDPREAFIEDPIRRAKYVEEKRRQMQQKNM